MSDKLSCDKYIGNILDDILSSDARTIIRSEDELTQTVSWTWILPTPSTHPYLQFLSYPPILTSCWMPGKESMEHHRREDKKDRRY
jgi:hypothetical protein